MTTLSFRWIRGTLRCFNYSNGNGGGDNQRVTLVITSCTAVPKLPFPEMNLSSILSFRAKRGINLVQCRPPQADGHLIMKKTYYVYLLASKTYTLYAGMTGNLEGRIRQHKEKEVPGFTSRYNVTRLVHYEEYQYVRDAIAREKQIKDWRRSKKIALIESLNPEWKDLAADWFDS